MSEQAEKAPQIENEKKTSEPNAITDAAGAIPSSLQDLKDSLNITKLMKEGTAIVPGVDITNDLIGSRKTSGPASDDSTDQLSKSNKSDRSPQEPKVDWEKIPSTTDGSGKNPHGDSKGHPMDKLGKGNDAIDLRNGIQDIMRYRTEQIPSDKQGTMKLATGDTFIRVAGAEVLVSPNGDTLVVNKDGSIDVGATKGVSIKHDAKSDSTTLTYPNGDTVRVSGGRITDVERAGASVHMNSAREERFQHYVPDTTKKREYPNTLPNFEKYENKIVPRK